MVKNWYSNEKYPYVSILFEEKEGGADQPAAQAGGGNKKRNSNKKHDAISASGTRNSFLIKKEL